MSPDSIYSSVPFASDRCTIRPVAFMEYYYRLEMSLLNLPSGNLSLFAVGHHEYF